MDMLTGGEKVTRRSEDGVDSFLAIGREAGGSWDLPWYFCSSL